MIIFTTMVDTKNARFLWISPFGLLVAIRIKEISRRLLEKGINPIILKHKLQKKEISKFSRIILF